jgi:outer membrane protein assembly factor BamB
VASQPLSQWAGTFTTDAEVAGSDYSPLIIRRDGTVTMAGTRLVYSYDPGTSTLSFDSQQIRSMRVRGYITFSIDGAGVRTCAGILSLAIHVPVDLNLRGWMDHPVTHWADRYGTDTWYWGTYFSPLVIADDGTVTVAGTVLTITYDTSTNQLAWDWQAIRETTAKASITFAEEPGGATAFTGTINPRTQDGPVPYSGNSDTPLTRWAAAYITDTWYWGTYFSPLVVNPDGRVTVAGVTLTYAYDSLTSTLSWDWQAIKDTTAKGSIQFRPSPDGTRGFTGTINPRPQDGPVPYTGREAGAIGVWAGVYDTNASGAGARYSPLIITGTGEVFIAGSPIVAIYDSTTLSWTSQPVAGQTTSGQISFTRDATGTRFTGTITPDQGQPPQQYTGTLRAQWPMTLQNPTNNGRSVLLGPADLAVRWRTTIGGKMRGGPVVDQAGNIYVGGENSTLYCLSPDGAIKWSYTDAYPFYPSPAVGPDGTIYAGCDRVVALTPAAQVKWKYEWHDGSGMIVVVPLKLSRDAATVYVVSTSSVGQSGRLTALRASDGALLWQFTFDGQSSSIPGIGSDGTVYVGSEKCIVYALKPQDGTIKWQYDASTANSWFIRGPVAVDDQDNVYFCRTGQLPDNHVISLTPQGTLRWAYGDGGYLANPPSVSIAGDGTVYATFLGMVALTPAGTFKWRTPTAGNVGIYPGAQALSYSAEVFFGTSDGKLFGYSGAGAQLWQFDQGHNEAAPALGGNGLLYFSDGGQMVIAAQGPVVVPITQAPTIEQVSYDGARVTGRWTPVSSAAVTGYRLAIFLDDAIVNSIDSPSTTASIEITLDPAQRYDVAARAVGDGVLGPWSARVPVIATVSTVTSVAYDRVAVSAVWTAAGDADVSAYVLGLFEQGSTTPVTRTFTTTSGNIPTTLDPTKRYTVKVQFAGLSTVGPWSAELPVIAARPTLQSLACDGGVVTFAWTQDVTTDVTGYDLGVFEHGGPIAFSARATSSPSGVPVTLDPNTSYDGAARATGTNTTGAWSDTIAIIGQAPMNLRLIYTGTALEAIWQPVTNNAVTGYTAELYKNQTLIETKSTTDANVTFAATFEHGAIYETRVRAEGTATTGPWSPLAVGPLSHSVTYTYDALGRVTTLAATGSPTFGYTYDTFGNVLTESVDS